MSEQHTLENILEIVQRLDSTMATKDDITAIRSEMATKDDIANMATKDDIADVRVDLATKQDIDELRDEVIDHVDSFVGKYQQHETELAAVSFRQQRTERKVDYLAKHLELNLNSV